MLLRTAGSTIFQRAKASLSFSNRSGATVRRRVPATNSSVSRVLSVTKVVCPNWKVAVAGVSSFFP
jgi:hypothetical protein